MKKLLVVLMVLTLAPLANAMLTISVNGVDDPQGPITLKPSDSAVIDIHGNGGTPSNTDYFLIVEGAGTISGGSMIYTGGLSEFHSPASAAQIATLNSIGYTTVNADYIVFAGPPPAPPLDGLLVDGITFHCNAQPGSVLLTLMNLVWTYDEDNDVYIPTITTMDTQTITQIPEPITIGLLGLGGLLLRRRK